MSGLSAADWTVVERWAKVALHGPSLLADDVEPVQVRLVRAVGRGVLPDAGMVYVKVMGFPRFRDRLRYAFRALPGVHEGKVLKFVRATGMAAPEVVCTMAVRRRLVPRMSLLVTAALPVVEATPVPAAAAAAARQLVDEGVFHPDLNLGNFAPLVDGRLALLDFQSARLRRAPLRGALRRAMGARLMQEYPRAVGVADDLVAARLLQGPEAADAGRRARELAQEALERRIRRCRTNSTEFRRTLRPAGTQYCRRAGPDVGSAAVQAAWVTATGFSRRDLKKMWLGDRTLEVLHGRPPSLFGLFTKWWWLPGDCSVYIPNGSGSRPLRELAAPLLAGFEEFRRLIHGQHQWAGRAKPAVAAPREDT